MSVNVGFSSFSESFIKSLNIEYSSFVSFLFTTFSLLIFGEIIPKSIGVNYPIFFIRLGNLLIFLFKILSPIVNIFKFIDTFFFHIKRLTSDIEINKEDLKKFINKIYYSSKFSSIEEKILLSIIKLSNVPVKFIMKTEKNTLNKIKEKDKFILVNSFSSIYFIFKRLILTDTKYAVIVDEYGNEIGYLQVDDLLKYFSENIEKKKDIKEIDEVVVDGLYSVVDLENVYGIKIGNEQFSTINGYITNKIGYIPKENEKFKIDNYLITILESSPTRIKKLKITKIQNKE